MKGSHIPVSPSPKFPSTAVPEGFGAYLRAARARRGLTQAQLADASGLSRETIVRLEKRVSHATSARRLPVADTVFRLEDALGFCGEQLVPDWSEWMPIGSLEPGARSRERRRSLGLTVIEVAAAAGVSPATLSRFEREERRTPSLLRVKTSELGGTWPYLVSKRYANALGFPSIAEHERYCARDEERRGFSED